MIRALLLALGTIALLGTSLPATGRPSRDAPATGPVLLGRSVQGRPIREEVRGLPGAKRGVLVVGIVHGNEPAGATVVGRLETMPAPRRTVLWLVRDLNPDGRAANTRQNARGVDLNRNFPWRWQPLGRRGDQQYSGPRPLSEPESRIAQQLILRLRPSVAIWFHQPLGLVDESGGDVRIERRFARLAGLPLRRLTRYPGSAVGWQDHALPRTTAFVVELPPGHLRSALADRVARAVLALAADPTKP